MPQGYGMAASTWKAVVDATTSPALRQAPLFIDWMIGAVRAGHKLGKGRVTAANYTGAAHIGISRQMVDQGGLTRRSAR